MKKTLLKTVATALVLSIVLSANMFLISAFAEEVLQSDEVPEGYIGIYDAYDLLDIKKDLDGKYILMNNIEIWQPDWNPIGTSEEPFTGIFDGNNKIIRNLSCDLEASYAKTCFGLFAYTSNATISNLYLKDVDISIKYSTSEPIIVGSIAGYADRTSFKNCIVNGSIKVDGAKTGTVGGFAGKLNICPLVNITVGVDVSVSTTNKLNTFSIGGIAGEAKGGTFNQCSNNGDVFASGYNSSDTVRYVHIGGIAGDTADSANQILNCYNNGNIGIDFSTPTTCVGGIIGDCWYVKNCYNSGNVTVPEGFGGCVGAIAGDFDTEVTGSGVTPRIENVYYTNEGLYTSFICSNPPADDTAYINAKKLTAEEFKDTNSFSGFNFNTVWQMDENGTPILKQQLSLYNDFLAEAESEGQCGSNVFYTFNLLTGYLHIYGTGEMYSYNSIAMIGMPYYAPWCEDKGYELVKNVVIDEGVTSIGACAFSECTNIESIEYPSTLKAIRYGAFSLCYNLESFVIPDGVEIIEDYVFYDCTNLKTVHFPKSVSKIDPEAFEYNSSLESITVDSENPNYSTDEHGVLYNKNKTTLVLYPQAKTLTSYTVPEGVTTIGSHSFSRSKISEINLPDSLKTIEWNAFEYCYNLKEIILPDGVETISSWAFCLCSGIESVKFSSNLKNVGYCAFGYCSSLKSIEIPHGTQVISYGAFMGCSALETVILPDTLIEIDTYAFLNTAYLDNTENREGNALYNGKYLLDVSTDATGVFEIKDGTELIAGSAFSGCSNLTEIVIPESVKIIGNNAFGNCDGLKNMVISENVTEIGRSLFSYCENLESVEINAKISTLDSNVFYSCEKLTSVKLPDTVTVIEYSAFYRCESLVSIELPEGLETIGKSAFESTELTYVTLPESLVSIGERAFYSTNIDTVSLSENVESIGTNAFSCTTSLTSIEVGAENTAFMTDGKALFSKDGTRLICYFAGVDDSIYIIPDGVTSIDSDAFDGCRNLEAVTIPASVTSKYGFTFMNCTNLKSAAIDAQTSSLGSHKFQGCSSLEKVYISSSVKEIGYRAFYGCENLKDIYYGGTEEEWGKIINSYGINATFHYNHVHSHTYSGYTESTVDELGYKLFTCECGHSYAEYDNVAKSEEFDVTAMFSPECFNEEITLDVEEVSSNRDPGGIYVVDGKTYVQVGVFTIKPVNENGEVIQPNEGETVKIKIAVPEEHKDKTEMVIYHRFVDGGREKLSTADGTLILENGYMFFEVSKFSEFEILAGVSTITVSTLPDKLEFVYKEEIDLSGIQLEITNPDGTVEYVTDTSKMTVEGFDSTKIGTQTVTVRYEDYSCTYEVTVRYSWWQWIIRIFLLGFFWY